jgi:hypothetical protein
MFRRVAPDISEDTSILASTASLDKMSTKRPSTIAPVSASRRLAQAVADVRTQMGHRGLGDGRLARVRHALRSRLADLMPGAQRRRGLQGGA